MKYNVLFVIESSFPFFAGGIENWLYNVIGILHNKINITIVSEAPVEYDKAMYKLPTNVKLVNYHSLRSFWRMRFLLRGPLGAIDYLTQKIFMQKAIKKVLNEDSINTIIALNTLNATSATLSFKKKYSQLKYISCARTMHAEFAASYFPFLRKHFFAQEKRNMLSADSVWSNGYDTQEYYRGFGIESLVMKNGVDYQRFATVSKPSPYPKGKVIVSVGTLQEVKGYSYLLKAFSLIKDKHTDANIYILGKGDPKYYQDMAKELGIIDRVIFEGHISDVSPYLQNATVCACLSGGSGLAMAAIEAMASGVPIIAWDTPVYHQFNHNCKTMELVPYQDAESLGERIDELLSNPSEYEAMSSSAQKEAKSFDWETVCDDILTQLNS